MLLPRSGTATSRFSTTFESRVQLKPQPLNYQAVVIPMDVLAFTQVDELRAVFAVLSGR